MAKQVTQAQREKFVRDVRDAAEAASRATGIDRDVIIAQAANETGWGTSVRGNNYFGIKGKGQTFTTHEEINGKLVKMKQNFRAYESPMDSFMDWAGMMNRMERYEPVRTATTPEAQIAAMGASGYATDSKYASTLRSVVKRVKGMIGAASDVIGLDGQLGVQGGVLGKGRKNSPGAVKALQATLKEAGVYEGEIDGDFGPQTERAVRLAQEAMGVTVDGKWGPASQQAAREIGLVSTPSAPGVSLEARDEAAAARQPVVPSFSEAQAGRTFSAPPRTLTAPKMPALTGSVASDPGASFDISGRLSPVSYHSAPKRVLTAPPGSETGGVDTQLARQTEALKQGWSIQAARQKAGIDPVSVPTPRPNPRYTQSIGANSPLASPSVEKVTPDQRRPDFDFAVGPANAPRKPDFDYAVGPANAPVTGGYASAVHSAPKRTLTSPSQVAQPIAPKRVQTTSIPQNVPMASGASSRPSTPPSVSNTFDILSNRSNFAPQAAPKVLSQQDFNARFGPSQSFASVAAATAPVFSAPKRALTAPAPPAGTLAGYRSTLAAQPAPAPTYQPTSPVAAAPIPRPNPLAAPQVAGATAMPVAPPSAFSKLAPGMIGMAMASSPMGVLGGMARLAAASLGNVNNPRGLGYDAGTAARNAAVARGVQSSDLVGNGASYGRKRSDGSVTGTTSRGTGYTSSNGGRDITIGGRSYKKERSGYSLKV